MKVGDVIFVEGFDLYMPIDFESNTTENNSKIKNNIFELTGVKKRFIETSTIDNLVHQSAKVISEKFGNDFDIIVSSSSSNNYSMPTLSEYLSKCIGGDSSNSIMFDISNACNGFLRALECCIKYMNSDKKISRGLVFACEKNSNIINKDDPNTNGLFSDGCGFCVLNKNKTGIGLRVLDFVSISNTSMCDIINNRGKYLSINGPVTFKYASKFMISAIQEILKKNNLKMEEISAVIPHQANSRIIEHVSKSIKHCGVLNMMSDIGNVSSASIPIVLSKLQRQNKIPSGFIILVSFGSGLSCIASLLIKD